MKHLLLLALTFFIFTSCSQDNDDKIQDNENELIGKYANIDYSCVTNYYDCISKMNFTVKDSLIITFAKNKFDVPEAASYTIKEDMFELNFGEGFPTDIIFKKINETEFVLQKDSTTWVKNDKDEFVYETPDCGKGNGKEECTISICEILNDTDVSLIMDKKKDSIVIKSTYSIENDTIINVKKQEGLEDDIIFYYDKKVEKLSRKKDNSIWEKVE